MQRGQGLIDPPSQYRLRILSNAWAKSILVVWGFACPLPTYGEGGGALVITEHAQSLINNIEHWYSI